MASNVIYALATARVQAAIAVFRVSGGGAFRILDALRIVRPPLRLASLRHLRHPRSGDLLDIGVVTTFAEGASFTGEESFELSVHGGLAVIDAVSDALEAAGARLAKPGEFSRRALAAGRLDLSQAESIADLIEAQTDAERRMAVRALDGDVGRSAQHWRDTLVAVLGLLETAVDFVEESLGDALTQEARDACVGLVAVWRAEADGHDAVDHDERVIALIGPPNAGKSSLFNAVAGRDLAIVTAQAGTTRDLLSTSLLVDGGRVTVVDTAGVREASDEVERIGVGRAKAIAESASRRVLILSADTWPLLSEPDLAALKHVLTPDDRVFWTKSDLPGGAPADLAAWADAPVDFVSAVDGTGRRALLELAADLVTRVDAPLDIVGATPRRRTVLRDAATALQAAVDHIAVDQIELAIEQVRAAAAVLDRLIGAVTFDDALDMVFRRFCVGK